MANTRRRHGWRSLWPRCLRARASALVSGAGLMLGGASFMLPCAAAFGQPAQAQPNPGSQNGLAAGGGEIRMPPGAQEATFEAPLWSARLFNGGPVILGVVPYEFDANVNPTNQARALASMAAIEAVSDVQFVLRIPSPLVHPNWIHIQDSSGNNANLGMIGGQQFVNIASWTSNHPNVNFVIVHELLHMLGFWHEHQRPDRDMFVQINDGSPPPDCIDHGPPDHAHNFTIQPTAQAIGPYDFESVMHYPDWAWSGPCSPTIVVLPPNQMWQNVIGQRLYLSQTDIDGLCTKYGCAPANNNCANATAVSNGETITDNRGATNSAAAGCAALQRDAWYVYDATCLGEVTMSLDNPSPGYTPALAVYEDPCGAGPLVSCDTSSPLTALFPVSPGERFYIRVGGTGSTMGTARLHIACAPIVCNPGLQWTQVATGNPGTRWQHAMAYDSARQRVILFDGNLDGQTWEWDSATTTWTLRTSSGPSPRYGHAMAYDSTRQRVVLFGGHNGTFPVSDTWEYDPVANAWSNVSPGFSPLFRWEHEMAYDSARQRVVLFGGYAGGAQVENDTWEWNGATGTWAPITPVGTIPAGRLGFGMAYDAVRQRTVMWGGSNLSGVLADTAVHEWNGTSWTQPGALSPVRSEPKLVYDSASNQVLLFGGLIGSSLPNDIWSWNGNAWNNLGNAGAPFGRWHHAVAFDQSAAALIVQGGATEQMIESDTWRALVGIPNENAAGALLVGNGMVSIDNRCAANGTGSCAELRDLWYRYNAAISGTLTASVTGANFAAEVAIYNAASPGGSPLACGTGSTPVATALTVPGPYLIRVGSATGIGGVGNLNVNGAAQPCPPTFDVNNVNTYKHRLFVVTGTSNGLPWAWKITRGSDVMFDLNVPGIPAGASASALSAAFAASIAAHPCDNNRLWAVHISGGWNNSFRVLVGGSTSFSLCVGPAGQNPTCCMTSTNWCPFNPDIREIMLSDTDCNKNGMDDTIDLLQGDAVDIDYDGVLDICQAVCPADFDKSGDVGFADLTEVLIHWGPCEDLEFCLWDVDGSNDVGFGDLTGILLSWGGCEGVQPQSCDIILPDLK